MTSPGSFWGTDVPVSMPEPTNDDVLVDMGALGFGENGIVHNLNSSDLENYKIPTFSPGGSLHGE